MYFKSVDFSTYSSIKIGQPTKVLILERDDDIPTDRYLVGGANNLLISPTPPPLMMLGKDFATIDLEDTILTVGCAMPIGRILSFAKRRNIAGFEFFAKLPSSLGGMLAMNAGVKNYEVFNILHSVNIDGRWIERDEIEYGYRYARLNGVALEARFEIGYGFNYSLLDELIKLRNNQPKEPSAGSAFKNPQDDYAGRLIEAVGLKGYRYGDMEFSNLHSNFLVNLGNGSFEEAIHLLKLAKKRVADEFGITLEEEIKLL